MKRNHMKAIITFATLSLGISILGFPVVTAYAQPGEASATSPNGSLVEKAYENFNDVTESQTTKLSFSKGVTAISENEAPAIRGLVEANRADTTLGRVYVAAWSDQDQELAADGRGNFSAKDRKTAQRRAENVEKILKEIGVKNVTTFNMAENPSWIDRAFQTNDAELKEGLRKKATVRDVARDPGLTALSQKLRQKGGPSTVLVVVETAH